VLDGLAVFEEGEDCTRGVGEGIWLKSKKESMSGSPHWLLYDGVMAKEERVAAIEELVPGRK
jgi:hypothetical protein